MWPKLRLASLLRSNEIKKTVLKMLGELLFVTVGIYLGIVASNWNEQRKQVQKQRDFLQTLCLEIAANNHKLNQTLAYREKILATSNQLRQQLSKNKLGANFWSSGGFQQIKGWQGVFLPPLENSVYQSGLISNTLSELDFETINAIAQVYSNQEEYKLWGRTLIIDKLISMNDEVTTQAVLSNLQFWNDVIVSEKELIKKYQIALKQLNQKGK